LGSHKTIVKTVFEEKTYNHFLNNI